MILITWSDEWLQQKNKTDFIVMMNQSRLKEIYMNICFLCLWHPKEFEQISQRTQVWLCLNHLQNTLYMLNQQIKIGITGVQLDLAKAHSS